MSACEILSLLSAVSNVPVQLSRWSSAVRPLLLHAGWFACLMLVLAAMQKKEDAADEGSLATLGLQQVFRRELNTVSCLVCLCLGSRLAALPQVQLLGSQHQAAESCHCVCTVHAWRLLASLKWKGCFDADMCLLF